MQLGFEDILNVILEQPKLVLSKNCQELNEMNKEAGKKSHADIRIDQTLYMRYKKELAKDDEGNDLYIDFLLNKFKNEFDQLESLSQVRKNTLDNDN